MLSLKNLLTRPADSIEFDDSNTNIKSDTVQGFCEDIDSEVTTKVDNIDGKVGNSLTVSGIYPEVVLEDTDDTGDGKSHKLYVNNGGLFFYRMLDDGTWIYDAYLASDGTFIFENVPRTDDSPSSDSDLINKSFLDSSIEDVVTNTYDKSEFITTSSGTSLR